MSRTWETLSERRLAEGHQSEAASGDCARHEISAARTAESRLGPMLDPPGVPA